MSCEIETAAKDDQRKSAGRGYNRSKRLIVGAIVLAILVAWTSPTKGTWLFLVAALVLLGLLLISRRTGSANRWLSVKVHPGLVVLLTTGFVGLVATELALRL